MSRIVVEIADQHVDEDMKRILRENTPVGDIKVKYEREPSFFESCRVEGTDLVFAYAKDTDADRVVGMSVRAAKPVYINQELDQIAYLGSLRIEESHRKSFALIKFFRFLREIHENSTCKWDLMMFTDGNRIAESVVTSNRAGLPKAFLLGKFNTLVMAPKRASAKALRSDFEIRTLKEEELAEWFAFLKRTGPVQRNLFPAYEMRHLDEKTGLLRGLKPANIYVAIENGQIIGTISAWDQNAFKQFYIDGYSPVIKKFRWLHNFLSLFSGKPSLPKIGRQLNSVFLSVVCIKDERTEVFDQLLKRIRHDLALQKKYDTLFIGLLDKDPFLPIAQKYPHIAYTSNPWLASWDDEVEQMADYLSHHPLYLELASL